MLDLLQDPNDPGLRAALELITSKFIGDDVDRQVQSVRDLATQYRHTITLAIHDRARVARHGGNQCERRLG